MSQSAPLRALILIVIVACGSSPSEPPPAKSDAGKVTELVGKVTATRDAATRTLAVGNAIAPDDVIATGVESSVVIELFHNNARWSLEAGITSRVDASVAWTLPKQDAAAAVEHATSSAGRHADRQAAETQITAKPDVEKDKAADDAGDREAAKARLDRLRKEQVDMKDRLAAAKAIAEKAERKKGVKISKQCQDNPLARGCDGPGPELASEAQVAIKELEAFKAKLCACKDAPCATQVDAAFQAWRTKLAQQYPPKSKIGGDIAFGEVMIVDGYNQCRAAAGL